MRRRIEPGSTEAQIVDEELQLLERVSAFLRRRDPGEGEARPSGDHDADLIELRDAIAEAKPEDVAPLVEQMMRVSAVAAGRRGKVALPIDLRSPYFGHLRLETDKGPARDVLIGRRGLIDRQAGVQIVDWRDAPISQIYYRYDEGDDYEEDLGGGKLQGVVEVRRNVTIQDGRLRRIGCPQGSFFCDADGAWWQAEVAAPPSLRGGQGQAARAPRTPAPAPSHRKGARLPAQPQPPGMAGRPALRGGHELSERLDKHLPEIAALIDPDQFALITEPRSGLLVIQGGAGSGKTTVALHRVAYLAYQDPQRFKPKSMLIVVPSEALSRYVSGVLPSLGVQGVPVQTSAAWLRQQRRRLLPRLPDVRADDTPDVVSRLKKHPRMGVVVEGYLRDQEAAARRDLAAALSDHGAARERLLELWDAAQGTPLRRRCQAVRDAAGRGALESSREVELRAEEALRRLSRRAHDVVRDWAEILTDPGRLRDGLGAGVSESDIRALCDHCKAQQEEVEVLPEDVDPERYQAVDGRPLDEDSPAGKLDVEDDPILLWLYHRKHGGLTLAYRRDASPSGRNEGSVTGGAPLRYEHLVLDEAQDLSVLEVRLLLSCVGPRTAGAEGTRAQDLSVTIAGDVAQRLVFDNGFRGWEELLAEAGVQGGRVSRLRLLYRSTAEVMALSRQVLGPLAGKETEQVATRRGAPVTAFPFHEMGEAVAFLADALRSLLGREPTASVALVSRHAGTADAFHRALVRAEVPSLRRVTRHDFPFTPGIDVTDVAQVKGLEFDYVVILDATAAAYPDSVESRHLLHIAITRCAHQLWLLCAGTPSPLLPAEYLIGEEREPSAGEPPLLADQRPPETI